jgi:hypothetical protein
VQTHNHRRQPEKSGRQFEELDSQNVEEKVACATCPEFTQHSSMSKKWFVLLVVVAIVIIVFGVCVGLVWGRGSGTSSYTAVFLTSGDVYFGKLSWFPWPHLTNVWFLQRGVDQQNQPQLALTPFKSLFWGPAGNVYLNPKQILFWAPVGADSQVAKALENPSSVSQLPAQQQQAQQPPVTVPQQNQGNRR